MPHPDDSMTTAEELQHDREREDRINERVEEMTGDYEYIANAVIEPFVMSHISTTIKRVSEQETTDGEIMARDVGMEAVIKAIKHALRPVAEAEIDAMPVTTQADRELNRADRERDS